METSYRIERFDARKFDSSNLTYELRIRQQPKHSRMCGVGERADRRPIDPPPIVELVIKDKSNQEDLTLTYNHYLILKAILVKSDTNQDFPLLPDGRTRSTTGNTASSLFHLEDEKGHRGAFFIYPDLSVRTEGNYRLRFDLWELKFGVLQGVIHLSTTTSDIFKVYTAKKFPGMEESTPLSIAFANQGIKIRIRKESRMNKKSKKNCPESPDEDSHDGQDFDTDDETHHSSPASSEKSKLRKRKLTDGDPGSSTVKRSNPNLCSSPSSSTSPSDSNRPLSNLVPISHQSQPDLSSLTTAIVPQPSFSRMSISSLLSPVPNEHRRDNTFSPSNDADPNTNDSFF